MSQQNLNSRPQEEEINLREEFEKYIRFWPWFLLSVLIFLIGAIVYLRFSPKVYNTEASILIKDDKGKSASSELAAFADLGLLGGMGSTSMENEIGILKSRSLMTEVVKALNLNVTYYSQKNFTTNEVYTEKPFILNVLKFDENQYLNIPKKERSLYAISQMENDKLAVVDIKSEKSVTGELGKPIDLGFAEIVITKNDIYLKEGISNGEFLFGFKTVDQVANSLREKLQVNLTDKNSSLIALLIDGNVPEKGRDILDQLILEYNTDAIEDKNLVARNTASFIDERLSIINEELDSVETGKEEFKEVNRLTDIQAESSLFIENASDHRKKEQELGTQIELVRAMISYLEADSKNDLLPANLGISEAGVNTQIDEYNKLVLDRNRVLSGSTEKNPIVIKLNSQLDQIRNNVSLSLEQTLSTLKIAQADLNRQALVIGSKISSVPSKEREYRGIERQQNIKEALYLFLLQKREENSLSLAVTAPKAKIVDRAYTSSIPVSPKPKIILLAAMIVGLLIPFLVIYLRNLFNNKINSRTDIERVTKEIPIVGEIPRIEKKADEMISSQSDRSVLAEAFRILLTNLQYLLVTKESDKNTAAKIFVTSTVKGEGKTQVAFNLAMTLANTGKKVIVIGADLRNPQLQRFESDARSLMGVSDYLVGKYDDPQDFVKNSNLHENLFLLASGSIPPNPSELWRQERAGELFKSLETKYDYIVVDTAPVMLVTDTFLINKYADITLYVTRAGYTEKRLQQFSIDATKDGKLKDIAYVLNDVKMANFGYGNKYGYSYGEENKSIFKRLIERFSK